MIADVHTIIHLDDGAINCFVLPASVSNALPCHMLFAAVTC